MLIRAQITHFKYFKIEKWFFGQRDNQFAEAICVLNLKKIIDFFE